MSQSTAQPMAQPCVGSIGTSPGAGGTRRLCIDNAFAMLQLGIDVGAEGLQQASWVEIARNLNRRAVTTAAEFKLYVSCVGQLLTKWLGGQHEAAVKQRKSVCNDVRVMMR